MEKIFGVAKEKYLRGVVLYFKSADSILYYESTFKNKVAKADLVNMFNKGTLVVNDGTNFVRPTVLTVSDNYAAVTHTTVGASDKAVATSFYSEGYSAT